MNRAVSFGVGIAMLVRFMLAARTPGARWHLGYVPKERFFWFAYGVRVTQPQEVSVSMTAMRARESDIDVVDGWFAQVEPGLAGGKASIGLGGLSPSDHVWLPPFFGFGAKASVLRTWGFTRDAVPGQTLLGPELDLTFGHAKVTAGYLWRLGGSAGPRGVFTWGVGVGF